MKMTIMFALVLLSIGFVGCSANMDGTINTKEATNTRDVTSSKDVTDSNELTNSKKAQYQNISPADAKKVLESEKNIILLDVRTVEEYTEKHIPGTILIPLDVIEKEAEVKLKDKTTPILVYCRSGRRSVTASEILIKLGYTKVFNLGGINDWPYETETGAPKL